MENVKEFNLAMKEINSGFLNENGDYNKELGEFVYGLLGKNYTLSGKYLSGGNGFKPHEFFTEWSLLSTTNQMNNLRFGRIYL